MAIDMHHAAKGFFLKVGTLLFLFLSPLIFIPRAFDSAVLPRFIFSSSIILFAFAAG
jgi:hypothetical protein